MGIFLIFQHFNALSAHLNIHPAVSNAISLLVQDAQLIIYFIMDSALRNVLHSIISLLRLAKNVLLHVWIAALFLNVFHALAPIYLTMVLALFNALLGE